MKWILPEKRLGDSIVSHLLLSRGIGLESHSRFLNPELDHIHPASSLHDSKQAASVILEAVKAGKKIFVHGDYDVDGVSATAIIWDFLYRELNANVLPYIPSRFDEGYGLSPSSIEAMKSQGAELIITVDCGVKDIDLVREYSKQGLQFVITDHHTLPQAGEQSIVSQDALAVVHPRHPDGNYPFVEICGAMVAWKLCAVIAEEAGLETDMNEYLDLVALATVCDVMPLIDENRVVVKYGIDYLRKTKRPGLIALLRQAGVKPEEVQPYHLGFVIGPRLNAAGRLESAMDALRLLTTQSESQAEKLAQDLHNLNLQRQEITASLTLQAESAISGMPSGQKLYFIYGDDWPEGVVGLVAGKLSEKYGRPVIVGSAKEGIIKGSARSNEVFHIANAFKQAGHLLERHGGHAGAAGFTMKAENADSFQDLLLQLIEDQIGAEDLERKLKIDLLLDPTEAKVELVNELNKLEPFGFGNSTPIFALQGLNVRDRKIFGTTNQHIKFFLVNDDIGIEVIDFGNASKWSHINSGQRVDVAGNLRIDDWNGKNNLNMILKDIRLDN